MRDRNLFAYQVTNNIPLFGFDDREIDRLEIDREMVPRAVGPRRMSDRGSFVRVAASRVYLMTTLDAESLADNHLRGFVAPVSPSYFRSL